MPSNDTHVDGLTYVRCVKCTRLFVLDIKELITQNMPHTAYIPNFGDRPEDSRGYEHFVNCNGPYRMST